MFSVVRYILCDTLVVIRLSVLWATSLFEGAPVCLMCRRISNHTQESMYISSSVYFSLYLWYCVSSMSNSFFFKLLYPLIQRDFYEISLCKTTASDLFLSQFSQISSYSPSFLHNKVHQICYILLRISQF